MEPTLVAELAVGLIDAALQVISKIHGQGGMTPDEILAAAKNTDANTQALVKQYLAALPPAAPKA